MRTCVRIGLYMCTYRLVHVYVWACACVNTCACLTPVHIIFIHVYTGLHVFQVCIYFLQVGIECLYVPIDLIQCKWTTYEVVCTSSRMVLKVFSMAVHVLLAIGPG